MKYNNNLTITNPRSLSHFSLNNFFDDISELTKMTSKCTSAETLCATANKHDKYHQKWEVDKDSKNETRLICKDSFGNTYYLIAHKEKEESDMINKKDLRKLFQDAADTDQDELDFYSQLVSAGITIRDVFECAGPEQANAMFLFCHEHGLLNEDKETEYVYQMICNLLSINKNYEKYDFKLFDKIWIYTVKDCARGVVIADDDEEAKEKVLNAYMSHYTEFDPEYATIQINKAVENNNVFSDCPYVIEVE